MRLYYHPLSTCSRRVLMTADLLGIPLDLCVVDLAQGQQHSPAFLHLNPNHKVPVLDHDGFVLWESYAIMQYLADTFPDPSIYPTDRQARADVNRWLFWCGQEFMPGVALLNWEHSIKQMAGAGFADPSEVARGERLFRAAAKILDEHLGGQDWICSSGLSLADIALGAPLADQDRARLPVQEFPHLQRWFGQVRQLEAWTRSEL